MSKSARAHGIVTDRDGVSRRQTPLRGVGENCPCRCSRQWPLSSPLSCLSSFPPVVFAFMSHALRRPRPRAGSFLFPYTSCTLYPFSTACFYRGWRIRVVFLHVIVSPCLPGARRQVFFPERKWFRSFHKFDVAKGVEEVNFVLEAVVNHLRAPRHLDFDLSSSTSGAN